MCRRADTALSASVRRGLLRLDLIFRLMALPSMVLPCKAHAGQADVQKPNVGAEGGGQGQRRGSVGCLVHFMPHGAADGASRSECQGNLQRREPVAWLRSGWSCSSQPRKWSPAAGGAISCRAVLM